MYSSCKLLSKLVECLKWTIKIKCNQFLLYSQSGGLGATVVAESYRSDLIDFTGNRSDFDFITSDYDSIQPEDIKHFDI